MSDDVDPDQHLRVAKALEQVNALKYRYYASPKDAKKVLTFHSDDSESGEDDNEPHRQAKGERRKSSNDEDDDDDETHLSFDDHIDRILRKTRTIALLKIANNTAEILPYDDEFDYEGDMDDEFYDSDAEDDDDETDDKFVATADQALRREPKSSFRNGSSMRTMDIGGDRAVEHSESAALMRLVRTLSTFLSLPRVISYNDLEMITESLLDEPSGKDHDDYGELIDCHVDSARDSSTGGDPHAEEDHHPLWKRRNTASLLVGFPASENSIRMS